MKKCITLLFVITATQIPISCLKKCGGEPSEGKISDLKTLIGTFENDIFFNKESISYEKAAILIEIAYMEFSYNSSIPENFNNPFVNQAYACSPPPASPTQKINEIAITSSEPLFSKGKEIEAGSNLNELFKVSNHDDSTIDEFIFDQNEDLWLFGRMGSELILTLNEKPDRAINQEFRIKFEFSDFETIEVKTEVFQVN